jgi:hypothetical protein
MNLKRAIKYNIKLGDFRNAWKLGEEFLNNEKDSKNDDFLKNNLHEERIIYNLALVALKIKEYEKGIGLCQRIFENKEQSNNTNTNNNATSSQNNTKKRKTEYINWQKGKEDNYPGKNLPFDNDYENKLKNEEYHIKLKLYMKMIIRSIAVEPDKENKKIYLQAILRFYDSAEEKEAIKEEKEKRDLNEIQTALKGNGNLKEYFKSKILEALKQKNKIEENPNEKTQMKEKDQQNSDYEVFKKLFSYFENDKVFYSFNRGRNKVDSYHGDFEDKNEDEKEGNFLMGDKETKKEIVNDDSEEDSQDDQQSNDSKGRDNSNRVGFNFNYH